MNIKSCIIIGLHDFMPLMCHLYQLAMHFALNVLYMNNYYTMTGIALFWFAILLHLGMCM